MASVNPMTAVAAYRSAAMSIVHQQGVTSQAQAQMRVPPMLESVGGASPPPHGINGSITPSGPQYPFVAGKAPELSFAALVKSGVQNTIDANKGLNKEVINIAALSNGVYFLTLQNSTNRVIKNIVKN